MSSDGVEQSSLTKEVSMFFLECDTIFYLRKVSPPSKELDMWRYSAVQRLDGVGLSPDTESLAFKSDKISQALEGEVKDPMFCHILMFSSENPIAISF
jgi:hypothetical protein